VKDATAYIITDTLTTGVIAQVTGRLVTLTDGTRFVAAPQRMIRIGHWVFMTIA
jgi:hypothetical protein